MSTKLSTWLLVVVALTLLAVLASHVRVGATADSIAVLKTTGMTCGSCASKISQALQATKGVAVTEVDVERGWVIVGYDMNDVKPEALADTVRTAGFPSMVSEVLTPEQFRQITGRNIGKNRSSSGGCGGCGPTGGGCGAKKQN